MVRSERGSQLVEAAIIVPILVLLLLGIVDLGRVFYGQIVITNAVREGARYGSRYSQPSDYPAIKSTVTNEISNSGACTTVLACPCSVPDPVKTNDSAGKEMRVSATCGVSLITPLVGSLTGTNSLTIGNTAAMKVIGVQ
jgi:Flp pilus assembly protein TadG